MRKDICVDDCLFGGKYINETLQIADEFELVLNKGGLSLKGIIVLGRSASWWYKYQCYWKKWFSK